MASKIVNVLMALALCSALAVVVSGQDDLIGSKVRLVGGGNRDLFIRCDTNTWRCYCTPKGGSQAPTVFEYTSDYQLKVPGSNLCLNIWGGGNKGDINLWQCDPITSNCQWRNSGDNVVSGNGGGIWWTGEGYTPAAVNVWSPLAWQIKWQISAAGTGR